MTTPAYKRVLLKLSGEALMGDDSYGINRSTIERMVADVFEVASLGVEVAIVIGGGPLARGAGALSQQLAVPVIAPIPAAVRRLVAHLR